MKTVRMAQAALFAVGLSACAHTSSGRVENASSVEANAGLPERSEATATLADGSNTMGSRTRFIYLGSAQVDVPSQSEPIYVEGATCSPWTETEGKRCTFEEITAQLLR